MRSSIEKEKQRLREFWKESAPKDLALIESWSEKICKCILASDEFNKANHVGLFYPRAGEVDLTSVWKRKPSKCVFPKTNKEASELVFYTVDSLEDLAPGYGGIMEPESNEKRRLQAWSNKDLILVPGLVFDSWGGRIGTGRGFYDRFLGSVPPETKKWGVSFSVQYSKEKLAQVKTDVRMDAVCTEKDLVVCKKEEA